MKIEKLLKKLITATTWKVEVYTKSYNNISSGGNFNWEETVTKSGYYPVGVVGFSSARASLCVEWAKLADETSGSCKIQMHAKATSAVSANTARLCVLWVKE